MTTQVQGVTYRYTHTIGRGEEAGPGFKNPVSVARGADNVLYVVNRAYDYRADSKRITVCTVDEDYLGEIGNGGRLGGDLMDTGENASDGSLVWPTDIALDSEENLYITDEWLNRVAIFAKDGDWVGSWGAAGDGEGQFSQPSGIHFDADGNVMVVDTGNNRVQKYTKDGQYISSFGSFGSGDGELNMPWGIDIDKEGNIFVADWRNDRVQKFDADGNFLMKIGSTGTEEGQFKRPTGVAVDNDGIIYVADWDNDRVQVFDSNGLFISVIMGDATLSKWGITKLDANPDMKLQREIAQGLEREKFLRGPIGVEIDDDNRLFIVDSQRNRIQIYRKIDPYFVGMYDGARL